MNVYGCQCVIMIVLLGQQPCCVIFYDQLTKKLDRQFGIGRDGLLQGGGKFAIVKACFSVIGNWGGGKMVGSNLVLRYRLGDQEWQEAAFQKREVVIGWGEDCDLYRCPQH